MKRFTQYILGVITTLFSLSAFAMSSYGNYIGGGSGPEQLMDPCITKSEAKILISPNNNTALIFDKSDLRKIVRKNNNALAKLKQINAERILVLPVSHLGIADKCKSGAQVYFTFIDEYSGTVVKK